MGNINRSCIWLFGIAYASSVNDIRPNLHAIDLAKQKSEHFANSAMSLEGDIFFQTSK